MKEPTPVAVLLQRPLRPIRTLFSRVAGWADVRGLPLYAQVRGLWLLVHVNRAQGEERANRPSDPEAAPRG